MKKTQRFFALILCVIMLLPILGCGQNKPRESKPLPSQTVQESAPAPESSKPSGPVYDTEPPIMESEPESSEPPVTESEPENSEPISEEAEPEEHYFKPFLEKFRPMGEQVYMNDLCFNDPGKDFHEDMWLGEIEQYGNDNYYYIVFNDTKSEIYHIAVNSEPRLLYSTEDQIEHIAASDKDVFFTTENTFYSVPAEGGEAKELCACENITFIDVIDSNTVFLVDSRSKGWHMDLDLAEQNDNGDWDIIPYDWETSRYYCYSVSNNTLEEWAREDYLHALSKKEYFEVGRFSFFSNYIYEQEITDKDYVIVFDNLTGAYKTYEDIPYTMSYDTYHVKGNEVLMLTPYREEVIYKAEGNIDAFCFDNNRNIYFVSEENLYFADINKGINTLIDHVGKVTYIHFTYSFIPTTCWKIIIPKIGYGEDILNYVEYCAHKSPQELKRTSIYFNIETGERYE